MGVRVTVVDEETGQSETQRIEDGDYVLIAVAPCWLAHTQVFAGGRTHQLTIKDRRAGSVPSRVTHGRHCPCSACARQDWTDPTLAPCGEHGPACPSAYAPRTA